MRGAEVEIMFRNVPECSLVCHSMKRPIKTNPPRQSKRSHRGLRRIWERSKTKPPFARRQPNRCAAHCVRGSGSKRTHRWEKTNPRVTQASEWGVGACEQNEATVPRQASSAWPAVSWSVRGRLGGSIRRGGGGVTAPGGAGGLRRSGRCCSGAACPCCARGAGSRCCTPRSRSPRPWPPGRGRSGLAA